MVGYNEAKTEILDAVHTMGELTTREIAELTNRRYEAASMAMLGYHLDGLLSRRKVKGREYAYSLTPRGVERLEWLQYQV